MVKEKMNPWEVDEETLKSIEKENRSTSGGITCPKRNACISKPCFGCSYIQSQVYAKQFPDQHPARKWASEKKAKASVYFNAIDPANPNVALLLRVGVDAGSSIINGLKEDWTGVLNPLKSQGRELKFKKYKGEGNYNKYRVEPVLEAADYDIPKAVLMNLHNLDQSNLIEMIESGDMPDSYFDISSMKMDEVKRFRLCPPWTTGVMGKENKRPLTFIWRHWGLSKGQIEGTEPLDWQEVVPSKDAVRVEKDIPWDSEPKQDTRMEEVLEEKSGEERPSKQCYGRLEFWEEGDSTCLACQYYKPCGKLAMSGK